MERKKPIQAVPIQAKQRRFFDQHAASLQEAADFRSALGQLLVDIEDDSLTSQMRCAAFIAKLRLAPVIMTYPQAHLSLPLLHSFTHQEYA